VNLYDQLEGNLVHRLAARSLIRDLERAGAADAAAKEEIARLGQTYGVVSSETTLYVAHDWEQASSADGMRTVDVHAAAHADRHARSTERAHYKEDALLTFDTEKQLGYQPELADVPSVELLSSLHVAQPTALLNSNQRERCPAAGSDHGSVRAGGAPLHAAQSMQRYGASRSVGRVAAPRADQKARKTRNRLSSSPQAGLHAKVAQIFDILEDAGDRVSGYDKAEEECCSEEAWTDSSYSVSTFACAPASVAPENAMAPSYYGACTEFASGLSNFDEAYSAAPPPPTAPLSSSRRALKRSGCVDASLPVVTQICMHQGANGLFDASGLSGTLDGLLGLPESTVDTLVDMVVAEYVFVVFDLGLWWRVCG
jgi:hypothetical protein